MKIRNMLLTGITALSIFTVVTTTVEAVTMDSKPTPIKCSQTASNNLKSNQTELLYMYSNKEGHFFIDPKAETENVIFVGLNDYKTDENFKIDTTSLHHGKKFIGTFADDTLWELISIKETK